VVADVLVAAPLGRKERIAEALLGAGAGSQGSRHEPVRGEGVGPYRERRRVGHRQALGACDLPQPFVHQITTLIMSRRRARRWSPARQSPD
jgi:hypothetical protein